MNKRTVKISSNWTNIGVYVGLFLAVFLVLIFVFTLKTEGFKGNVILFGLFVLIIVVLIIYQFMYACEAKIVDNKLMLTKQFRPTKYYAFDKIKDVSSFKIKHTNYIIINMQNDDNNFEKYLIINTNSLLAFENKDAERVLKNLKRHSKKEDN